MITKTKNSAGEERRRSFLWRLVAQERVKLTRTEPNQIEANRIKLNERLWGCSSCCETLLDSRNRKKLSPAGSGSKLKDKTGAQRQARQVQSKSQSRKRPIKRSNECKLGQSCLRASLASLLSLVAFTFSSRLPLARRSARKASDESEACASLRIAQAQAQNDDENSNSNPLLRALLSKTRLAAGD